MVFYLKPQVTVTAVTNPHCLHGTSRLMYEPRLGWGPWEPRVSGQSLGNSVSQEQLCHLHGRWVSSAEECAPVLAGHRSKRCSWVEITDFKG